MEETLVGRTMRGAWTVRTIALLLIVMLLASCGNGQEGQQGGGEETGQPADEETEMGGGTTQGTGGQGGEVSVSDITDSPEEFYGQTVTVSGAVGEFIEPRGLVIVPEQTLELIEPRPTPPTPEGVPTPQVEPVLLDEGVLVVSTTPLEPIMRDIVRVTGTVRQFDRAEVGQEVNHDLRARYYGGWRNKPVIIAQSVEQVQGGGETTSLETTEQMQETTGQ